MAPHKSLIHLSCGVFLMASLHLAQADDLGEARKAIRLQQYSKAAELFQRSADSGNSDAQYQLGNLYLLGRGVQKDEQIAREWFLKAAQQNHPGAQFSLAQQVQTSNPNQAKELIQAAAQQGFAPAKAWLEKGPPEVRVNQDAPIETQWFGAARANQISLLTELLQQHNNINLTDSAGRTALFYAVEAGNKDTVSWLIDQKIDVRHQDHLGLSATQTALERRHPNLVQTLLSAGADPTQVLSNGDSLLLYAIRLKQYDLIAPLVKLGVPLNHTNLDGWSALDLAESQGAKQVASSLGRMGAKHGTSWRRERTIQDVNAVARQLEQSGASALTKAITNNNAPLLDQLVRQNPPALKATLDDGSTPLILAVKQKKPDMVKALLQHKAPVNQQAYRGVTALHVAVQTDQENLVAMLLAAGAQVGIADDSGRDALITALEGDRYSIADKLLKVLMGKTNDTATIKAQLAREKIPVDRYILLATQHKATDVLNRLLPFASSAAAVDEQQRNALWFAAAEGNPQLISRLLQAGVSASQLDSLGRTPFMIAVDKGCIDCAQILLSHSDIDQQSVSGNSALIMAALNKDSSMVSWLLKNKAQLELRNQQGDTALMVAVSSNAIDVVRQLLSANANVTRKNRLGFSAIDLAREISPQMHELVRSKAVLGVF